MAESGGAHQQTAGSKRACRHPSQRRRGQVIHKSQETACEKGAAQPVHKGRGRDPLPVIQTAVQKQMDAVRYIHTCAAHKRGCKLRIPENMQHMGRRTHTRPLTEAQDEGRDG